MAVAGRVLVAAREGTRFGAIRHWEDIDSTNSWLRAEALAGAAEGLVAVADHQHAGRGRLDRRWDAPPGSALLVSVLLRPVGLDPSSLHLTTAAVALAARQACGAVGGFTPDLKWPNDLLVGDAKLAGVLAEAVPSRPAGVAVVVGIGCNLHAAPDGAATADAAAGRRVERDDLLLGLLVALEARLVAGWASVAEEHRTSCATVGRRVRVELHGRTVVGEAVAVGTDGRLHVRPDDDAPELVVGAGDVVHLRPLPRG